MHQYNMKIHKIITNYYIYILTKNRPKGDFLDLQNTANSIIAYYKKRKVIINHAIAYNN